MKKQNANTITKTFVCLLKQATKLILICVTFLDIRTTCVVAVFIVDRRDISDTHIDLKKNLSHLSLTLMCLMMLDNCAVEGKKYFKKITKISH